MGLGNNYERLANLEIFGSVLFIEYFKAPISNKIYILNFYMN